MNLKFSFIVLLLGLVKIGLAQSQLNKSDEQKIVDAVSERMQLQKMSQRYLNLGFAKHNLHDSGNAFSFDSKIGAHLTSGRTFYMHRSPVANILKIGLDWTYLDLNYSQFEETSIISNPEYASQENDPFMIHKAEVAMQIGPSFTILPVTRLAIKTYFRYAPSYSAMYDNNNEEFGGGFGSYFVTGVTFNYGIIGLGVEQRWGSSKHNVLGWEVSEDGISANTDAKQKINIKGPRIFFSLAF